MNSIECTSCRHAVDAAAKICPYCGANPATGEKIVDADQMLQEVFHPREISTSETVLEYARQRQGVVITVVVIVAFLVLGALHQFVSTRNANAVADTPSVPLTEVTDLANRQDQTKPLAMPDLDFQYGGRPQVMRTMIVEPGAITPPEVIAAQQAAAAAAAPKPPAIAGAARPAPAPGQRPGIIAQRPMPAPRAGQAARPQPR